MKNKAKIAKKSPKQARKSLTFPLPCVIITKPH
jgi:hypothetical protein